MKTLIESAERFLGEDEALTPEQNEGGAREIGKEELQKDTAEDLIDMVESYSKGLIYYMKQLNSNTKEIVLYTKWLALDIKSIKNAVEVFIEKKNVAKV